MRAQRLQLPMDKLNLLSATDVEGISSAPGSVSQVRESASALTRYAKQSGAVLILVGHVTKDGTLAGPKVLEHIIDCSIMIEGTHDSRFRTLRGHKNRFGAVNELGVFAMTETGMREVSNPSAAVLHKHGGVAIGDQDVFVNAVGGVKIIETSADLALIFSLVSSFRDRTLPKEMVVFGEIGLSGEIRPVPSGVERLREAAKHGFKKAIVPVGASCAYVYV